MLQIYDTSGLGKLTSNDFMNVLMHTMAMNENEALEIFHQVDQHGRAWISFGNGFGWWEKLFSNVINFSEQFQSYAAKKAEFAGLFSISKEEKFTPRNGEICPSDYIKKHE